MIKEKLLPAVRTSIGIALLSFCATTNSAPTKAVELKMGFYQNDSHIFVKVAKDILPKLEERTDGKYKFGIYTSEALGKAPEQIDVTNRGLVFGSLICTCYYPGTFPLFNIETVPIWTNGVEGVQAAFDGGLSGLYESYLHERGLKNIGILGTTAFSVRSLGMREKEVHQPTDLKGKRVRGLGYERTFIEGSEASVLTMPMPQVMEALERNMLDGVMAQESNWIDWKLYESLDSIAFLDLTTSPMTIIYSLRHVDDMSEEHRAAVLDTLTEYKDALTAAYGKFMDDSRDYLQNKWEGNAYQLTKEEKEAFVAVAHERAISEFLEKAGDRGQEAVDIVKAHNP